MRHRSRRLIGLLVAVTLLLPLAAAPANALTLQRTWSARIGSSGTNGAATLRAYTNGVASMTYDLRNLAGNTTYGVKIRKGTCTSLGSVVVTLPSVHTSATGTVAHSDTLLAKMSSIWPVARRQTFVIRFGSGTSARCGKFSFAHATRIAISSLGINLPVIRGSSSYPYCRVAMYHARVSQPREPGVTYIYAHARTGMFLPLLRRSKINNGASMIGMTIKVWTSDSYVSYYRITRVRRHVRTMTGFYSLSGEKLWLQTSEGPNSTYPKLIVEASRYKTIKSSYSAAHPTPHPVRC